MKIPFYVSIAASGITLILSIVLFIFGGIDQSLQAEIQKQQQEIQKQQQEINTGNSISNDVGPKLLRDMAVASIKDEKMKELLAKHGYTVATPTPAPASSPAPAAPSTPTPALRP
jgi:hypothetical protein